VEKKKLVIEGYSIVTRGKGGEKGFKCGTTSRMLEGTGGGDRSCRGETVALTVMKRETATTRIPKIGKNFKSSRCPEGTRDGSKELHFRGFRPVAGLKGNLSLSCASRKLLMSGRGTSLWFRPLRESYQ